MCHRVGGRHDERRCHRGSPRDCGGHTRLPRRFWTKEERIARLEEYLQSLQAETSAVGERIAEMKKDK